MGFEETLNSMRECIRASLDELASPRSSPSSKTNALKFLEKQLATACFFTANESEAKDAFLALQHTFECNIPSHLLPWITLSTLRLEGLTSRSLVESERAPEMDELSSQLNYSLSLIQGIVLNHEPSKEHLGRKCSLEILLELLLASRYLPTQPDSTAESAPPSQPHVTSVVLDTFLCILVDSTAALRTFEAAGGVHAVVKILKRAGTPREVRMKCLEFLYFYLLDETPSDKAAPSLTVVTSVQPTPPPTAPATPIRPSKPYIASNTGSRPMSRYGSSTFSFTSIGSLSFSDSGNSSSSSSSSGSSCTSSSPGGSIPVSVSKTLRSMSGSSTHSFSSTSSNASSSTALSSVEGPSSPVKETRVPSPVFIPPGMAGKRSPTKGLRTVTPQNTVTPPNSPPMPSSEIGNRIFRVQPRSLMMLRKEVDYIPQSPKKSLAVGIGRPAAEPATPQSSAATTTASMMECARRVHRKSLSTSTLGAPAGVLQRKRSDGGKVRSPGTPLRRLGERPMNVVIVTEGKKGKESEEKQKEKKEVMWKTTEEKKELLGTMLGNVDALVEGVRKAGIWGLG